jgi:TonB family protein
MTYYRQLAQGLVCVAALLAGGTALAQLVAPHVAPAPPPEFPAEVAQRPVAIKVEVRLDAEGHVTSAKIDSRDPEDAEPIFDERALAYAKGLHFEPATKDGKAIKSRVVVRVDFAPPPTSATSASASTSSSSSTSSSASASASASTGPASPSASASSAPSAKASAAPATSASSAAPPDVTEPQHVEVIGHSDDRTRGTSDFRIKPKQLAMIPRANATQYLTLAPSIMLTNEGGEGHAEQVFLRGFDAREGQDVEFTVGGVPINDAGNLHGNGYADSHFIIPELISTLRVLEGPFDPHQGNFAVAGSADYELGLEQRGLTTKFTAGSFNAKRWLLLWGPQESSTHTFGGAEIYQTDGFGQNRDAKRGTAMAQYEAPLGSHSVLRVTGTAYATTFHTAGVLRDDDYRAGRVDFFGTYDPNQGGDASRYSIALDYESAGESVGYRQLVFVIDRSMRLRENFTGFLLDVQEPQQNPHAQRGDLIDLQFDGLTIGARGSARYKAKVGGLLQELEFGYFARGDRTSSTQYRVEAATGHPYHLETDLTSTLGDLGLYADANLRATRWLTFRGGLRADLFTFNVLDNCAVQQVAHASAANPPGDASCLSQQNMGAYREPVQRASTASAAFLPRATALIGPLQGFTLSLSYGQGVRSIDPVYISQDLATPFASIKSYEGGVGYLLAGDTLTVNVRSVFFVTKVDKDLVFSETAGRATLANGTTRTGWLGAVRATGDFFDESASVTLVRSEFDDTHLLVPYVPDLVIRSDTAVFHELPWEIEEHKVRGAIGAGFSYVGHRALPYGQRSDAIFTIDTTATLAWHGYEVGLAVTNLLDRRYRLGELNYASNFRLDQGSNPTLAPMRSFTAGAPRAVYLTLGASLGGS